MTPFFWSFLLLLASSSSQAHNHNTTQQPQHSTSQSNIQKTHDAYTRRSHHYDMIDNDHDNKDPSSLVSLQALAPIISGISLFVGTGSTLWIAAHRQREKLRVRQQQQQQQQQQQCKENSTNTGTDIEDLSYTTTPTNDVPFRFLTVSASTNIVGSLTYNLFVVTAFIHGISLILTAIYQNNLKSSSNDNDNNDAIAWMGISIASIAATSIILTSLLPAKGSTTCIHIVMGAIYIEAALIWMTWTASITNRFNPNGILWGIRIGLLTVGAISMTWAIIWTRQTMSMRRRPGLEQRQQQVEHEENEEEEKDSYDVNNDDHTPDEWYQSIHKTAVTQMIFGTSHALMLATVAWEIWNKAP